MPKTDVTVQMSPTAKKIYDYHMPSMDLLIYCDLKISIVHQLEGGFPSITDLDKAVEMLTELNAELYQVLSPNLVTPFRIKNNYLWYQVPGRGWRTVAEHDTFLTEEI